MGVFNLIFGWISQASIFLLLLLFIALLGYCMYIKYTHMKYDHIPGPPRDSFFFGHTSKILEIMKDDGVTYGPVYKIYFLHHVMVFVSCPETTKEMLMSPKYTKDKFLHNRISSLFGQRFLGNGLVTVRDHEKWYKQRRIMDPAFSSLYLRSLMGNFNETADKLMDKLSEIADNKTTANMLHLVNCVTMEVLAKVAFGVDLDLLRKSSPFPRAVELCLKGMLNPKNWSFIREVRGACRLLRQTGAQWIQQRKTAMRNGEVPKDILTQIIKSAGKVLIDSVNCNISGQETTANQLGFCIMELGRHPDILERVKKEVDEAIGMKQDISYDDLGHLGYLSQVLKETLRLYPTAPGTSRDLKEDMVIGGVHVPGGVVCVFSSYGMGRMETFFKDPLKFDPDRFDPDAPKPYYCYFPFSLGPRSCLGQNFAQMEAKVVMAKLIQRFDFTLLPGQSFDILDNGTLRPKSGVLCSLRHRDHKK
uniref:Cholesterol 24-hydroxylase n=1 Tax=Takifugu rubripes TaxID=31033 RepID=A0A674MVM9_TAKRU